MAPIWKELDTQADWDPWVVGQLFATFAGWDNDEAVAIEATTIADADKHAAQWRNRGGGGAGQWQAADGTEIAAAPDSGWTFAKPITGTSASFSGRVTANGLTSTSDVTGVTGSFSGRVTANGLTSTSDVTGVTGAFSGAVTVDGNLTVAGNVAAGNANTDQHTVVGSSTFRNEAGAVQAFIDAAANKVRVGSATALSGATASILEVSAGRTYLAPANELYALGLRYGAATGQVFLGASNAATPDLLVSTSAGVEIGRFLGAAGLPGLALGTAATTATQGIVRTPNNTGWYGRATFGADARLVAFDSGNILQLGDPANVAEAYLTGLTGGRLFAAAVELLRWNGTGLGFFAKAPVAQQTGGAATAGATYTAAEQQMLNRAYAALRAYGLLT